MTEPKSRGDLAFEECDPAEDIWAVAERFDELLGQLPSVDMIDDQLIAISERIAEDAERDGHVPRALAADDIELRDRLLDLRLLLDVPEEIAVLGGAEIERRINAIHFIQLLEARRRGQWTPED